MRTVFHFILLLACIFPNRALAEAAREAVLEWQVPPSLPGSPAFQEAQKRYLDGFKVKFEQNELRFNGVTFVTKPKVYFQESENASLKRSEGGVVVPFSIWSGAVKKGAIRFLQNEERIAKKTEFLKANKKEMAKMNARILEIRARLDEFKEIQKKAGFQKGALSSAQSEAKGALTRELNQLKSKFIQKGEDEDPDSEVPFPLSEQTALSDFIKKGVLKLSTTPPGSEDSGGEVKRSQGAF